MSYSAAIMNDLAGNTRSLKASRWLVFGFWISTGIFALQMGFTAYAQLRLPQVLRRSCTSGFRPISGSSCRG